MKKALECALILTRKHQLLGDKIALSTDYLKKIELNDKQTEINKQMVDFLIELFLECKKHEIHTCIDTSGITYKPENIEYIEKLDRLLELTDLVMLDIKHIDPVKHLHLTGQPNEGILAFAYYLSNKNIPVWIRHVVVPGLTDDEEYLFQLGYFIGDLKNVKALDVLPYHSMGRAKYEMLGIDYKLKFVPDMDKREVVDKKKSILEGIKKRRLELRSQEGSN